MKFSVPFSCLVLFAAECSAKSPDPLPSPLTLTSATRIALERNPAVREARARLAAMKERAPQAAAWDDPKVSATTRVARFVDIAPNGFTDQMLSVEQMLPLSGKNRSRARIAAAEAIAESEAVRRAESEVVMKVRAAYFRLANGEAQLALNRSSEASLAQTRDLTRAKLEVGRRTQAEVLAAESELLKIGEAQRDLERAISQEETQLKVLLHADPFAPMRVATDASPQPEPSSDRLRALLLRQRPEIRRAEALLAAAKAKLELARRDWIPDPAITLQAQRYNDTSQAASEIGAGISFSVPWVNGGKYRAEEREARSGVEAAEHALEAARSEGLGQLRDQLQKIETAHHHQELFGSLLIPTARQAVEANRSGYEADKSSLLELVAAQRALVDAEAMQRQHEMERAVALAELEAIVGADLHLFPASTATPRRKP